MLRLQQRDRNLIDTLQILKVLTSSQIQRLFFNNCQQAQSRRCKQLVNHKHIKKYDQGTWQEHLYYIKKRPTQQLKSMLLLSEFYVLLHEYNINVVDFKREYQIPNTNIRCDGWFLVEKNGFTFEYLIEVDLTHWDGWKYEKELSKKTLFAPLISISPYKRKYAKELEVYYVHKDFKNIKNVIGLLE